MAHGGQLSTLPAPAAQRGRMPWNSEPIPRCSSLSDGIDPVSRGCYADRSPHVTPSRVSSPARLCLRPATVQMPTQNVDESIRDRKRLLRDRVAPGHPRFHGLRRPSARDSQGGWAQTRCQISRGKWGARDRAVRPSGNSVPSLPVRRMT